MKFSFFSLILFLSFFSQVKAQIRVEKFQSQEAADSAYSNWDNDDLEHDQIVVTATKTPKLLKNAPILTRVVSAIDIQKADATNIQDLMQQELPGVEFAYGQSRKINMNFSGFSGQRVLFLVDGERLAGETVENVDYTRLNMSDVERIEIVKGAASALYGSNAAGGVINVITKDDTKYMSDKLKYRLNLNTRFANHNEQRYNGLLNLSKGITSNTFSINRYSRDPYEVHSEDNPETLIFKTVYNEETWNFKDKITVRPIKQLKLSARAGYFFRQTTETENEPQRYRDFSGGVKAFYEISNISNIEVSYSFDQYDKSDFNEKSGLDIRDYSNVQNSIKGIFNHTFNEDVLTIGADFMHDYILNYYFSDGAHEQDIADFFLQYDWKISDNWELVGAGRFDYFSDKKDKRLTPKLSARYKLNRFNFRASYGLGFRAPTLKEKYTNFDIVSVWTLEGNPDLKAENSHSCNFSIDYAKNNYDFTINVYQNFIKDRIATTPPRYHENNVRYIRYINLDNMNVYGAEFSTQAKYSNGLGFKISYAFCHEDAETESMSQYTPAREHTATFRSDYEYRVNKNLNLNFCISGRVLSSIDNKEYADILDDNSITTIHYPAYTIWKFFSNVNIKDFLCINFTIDNIFNYKPKYYYYNAPLTTGANFMIGLSIDVDKIF